MAAKAAFPPTASDIEVSEDWVVEKIDIELAAYHTVVQTSLRQKFSPLQFSAIEGAVLGAAASLPRLLPFAFGGVAQKSSPLWKYGRGLAPPLLDRYPR